MLEQVIKEVIDITKPKIKLSYTINDLLSLSPNMEEKSKDYIPLLARRINNRWIYKVGDYIVTIRVPKISKMSIDDLVQANIIKEKDVNKLLKLKNRDVLIACTCNFWKFNGPDFNANENNYSAKVYSNLAEPNERDPDRKYYLCKHARSALKMFKNSVKSL